MLNSDIATLWDKFAYNAGFVVVRPTSYGRRVYELIRQKTAASNKVDDQTALNGAIRTLQSRKGFAAAILDVRRYVCGVDYFESSVDRWTPSSPPPLITSTPGNDTRRRPRCGDDDAPCPTVVHNNWIVSREAKVYRFKEHLMWMYDKGRQLQLNKHD